MTATTLREAPTNPFEPRQPRLSVITFVDAETLADQDLLNGKAYRRFAHELSAWLVEDYTSHHPVVLSSLALEPYSPEGRFDRVDCKLFASEQQPAAFEPETAFYLGHALVSVATQSGAVIGA